MKKILNLIIVFLLVLTVFARLPFQESAWAIGGDEDRQRGRTSDHSPGRDLIDKLRADAQVARNVGDFDWANQLEAIANHVNEGRTSAEESFDIAERANTGHSDEAMDLADRASQN